MEVQGRAADPTTLDKLVTIAERACIVHNTLAPAVPIKVRPFGVIAFRIGRRSALTQIFRRFPSGSRRFGPSGPKSAEICVGPTIGLPYRKE